MANSKHLEGLMDEPHSAKRKAAKTVPFFTMRRKGDGWQFVRVELDDSLKSVVSATAADPDVKAVSMEKFKIAVGRYWQEAEDAGA